MQEDKIWYIDRSRNYYYPELPTGLKAIVDTYKSREGLIISSDSLIDVLVDSGVTSSSAKNKNAHLTRFRDHGHINMYNNPSESVVDYVEGRLNVEGLIIDHFVKRPMYKDKAEPNIKPFVLICCFFSALFSITTDVNEYYVSMYECKRYLYTCKKYADINTRMVRSVISDRHTHAIRNVEMEDNEVTNFSIWFNALRMTSIMMPDTKREVLKPNINARAFFDFIASNAEKMEPTPVCDDKGDSSIQYEYYCNRRKGINEILPRHIKPNVSIDSENARKILLYLFGFKIEKNYKYDKYLRNAKEAFGVYFPLAMSPQLAMRHIWMQNSFVADEMYPVINELFEGIAKEEKVDDAFMLAAEEVSSYDK